MIDNKENDSWNVFFSALVKFSEVQERQKQRGLNDFTSLGSVLKANDEVRLHTRFIYSLLNPEGKHYQGTRFLELFLECIGRLDWLDIESTQVRKEYCPNGKDDQIDLYITDGIKEIVIENKLNAHDQPRQIIRYLDAIGANKPEKAEDTLFIYLTKNRNEPSPVGLGRVPEDRIVEAESDSRFLTLCGHTSCLLNKKGEPVAHYQNLWYGASQACQSIHSWLDSCVDALQGAEASNILWAIADYKSVVERATKEYVSNVTTLKDFLDEGIARGEKYHAQATQLAKELPSIHRSWLDSAMTSQLDDLFSDAIENGAFTKVDHDCAEQLDPFLFGTYSKDPAQLMYSERFNFFGTGKDLKNKGNFYRLETGPLKQRAILTVFYGSKLIHVGCLLRCDATEDEKALLKLIGLNDRSALKLRKSIFPEAWTQSELLSHQGIIDLADFPSSPQRALLKRLIDGLIHQEA